MVFRLSLIVLLFLFSRANGQEVYIDHVIKAVNDLDSTVQQYKDEGFIVKPGRLHKNGLLNAHIKFSNHSSLELMSLAGEPKDRLARTYKDILLRGGGGAFICLSGINIDQLKVRLEKKDYNFYYIQGKAWSYITFPENSLLHTFFFIDYHYEVKDEPELYQHSNGCIGFERVLVEGNDSVFQLMTDIGLFPVKNKSNEFKTSTGSIVILKNGVTPNKVVDIVMKVRN